ncbi:MAG: phage tail protein [Oscillospiraceae bacterium]|nr:phage tail protein [Oscillospiraceae bacterium]
MKPILYNKNETVFTTLGLGVLNETISCVGTEERNGIIEAAFKYPVNGNLYDKIDYDSIVKIKINETSKPQLFRIYKISKPIDGIVTYDAEHISYELNKNPIAALTVSGDAQSALQGVLNSAVVPHGYTARSDISASKFYKFTPRSVRAAIGDIRDIYGGELEFDNKEIILHANRGVDTGIIISYGKNLTGFKQDFDVSGVFTAIYPYAVKEDETTVTLPEKYISVPGAGDYSYIRAMPVDLSSEFKDDELTVAALRQKANEFLTGSAPIGEAMNNIVISFVHLWQTEEYTANNVGVDIAALESVNLCDIVTVRHKLYNLTAKAKVIKTKYDVLKERYISIELGTSKEDLSNSITKVYEESKKAKEKADEASKTAKDASKKVDSFDVRITDAETAAGKASSDVAEMVLEIGKFEVRLKHTEDSIDGIPYTIEAVILAELTDTTGLIKMFVEGKNYVTKPQADGTYLQIQNLYAGIETFINTATGQAAVVSAASSTYQKKSDMNDYVLTNSLNTSIGQYIDSVAGTAKIVSAATGTFQKISDMGGYLLTSNLDTSIGQYIDGTAGKAKIVLAATGTFQKISDMGGYLLTSNLDTSIGQYIDGTTGTAKIVLAATGTFQKISDMGGYVTTTTLNTSIGQYIDGTTGTAKIISAVSGTYETKTNVSAISQTVTSHTASINLVVGAGKLVGTSGAVSASVIVTAINGASSTVKITADHVDISGLVKISDLSGNGTTTINGANIKTGTISADRIDATTLRVRTIFSENGDMVFKSYGATGNYTSAVYIGGETSAVGDILLKASGCIFIGKSNEMTNTNNFLIDISNRQLYGKATWDIGTTAYKINNIYANNIGNSSNRINTMYVNTLNVNTLEGAFTMPNINKLTSGSYSVLTRR